MKFEEWLIDKHARQYTGLDDEMPDDFSNWLCELDVDDYIDYAEDWHEEEGKRNEENDNNGR